MPNIILTAVWLAYNFRKITMYIIKINLYLKNKQTKTITKQIVLKYYENPWKEDSTWALNLIKTHFRKTINAKLLPNDDLKVPNTKESLRTVFFQQIICPWLGHLSFNYTQSPAKSMHCRWFYNRMLECKLNRFLISTVCYQGFLNFWIQQLVTEVKYYQGSFVSSQSCLTHPSFKYMQGSIVCKRQKP